MKKLLQAVAIASAIASPGLTGAASATSSYVGPHGGTTTFDRDCYSGANAGFCHNVRTYTGPSGTTFERGRGFYSGPNSFGRTGHAVGPQGATGFYRANGYNGGRVIFRGWR